MRAPQLDPEEKIALERERLAWPLRRRIVTDADALVARVEIVLTAPVDLAALVAYVAEHNRTAAFEGSNRHPSEKTGDRSGAYNDACYSARCEPPR